MKGMRSTNYIFLIVFVFCAGSLQAQEADSVTVAEKQWQQQSGFFLSQTVVRKKWGTAKAGFVGVAGDFKLSQAPQSEQLATIATEGVTFASNKIAVAGGFAYQRGWHDSMGFTQRFHYADESPYYLYARQPGNWISENYRLNGSIAWQLNKRLALHGNANYFAADYARTNDPRPEVNYFKLMVTPGFSYQIHPKHVLGAAAVLGYSHNTMSTSIYNQLNESKDAFKIYLNEGYSQHGEEREWSRLSQFRNYTGFQLEYQWLPMDNELFYLKLGYLNMNEENFNILNNSNNKARLGDYNLFEYFSNMYWRKQILGTNLLEVSYDISIRKARDFNYRLLGNNFTFYGVSQLLDIGFTHHDKGWKLFSTNLTMRHENQERKDGNFLVQADFNRLVFQLQHRQFFYLGKNNQAIELLTGIGLLKNFSSKLNIGVARAAAEPFAKGVIFPDMEYFSADAFMVDAGLAYHFKLARNSCKLQAKANIVRRQNDEAVYNASAFTRPLGRRTNVDLSVEVNF
jgi:hypothetical protein